jgi:hypothetical protein
MEIAYEIAVARQAVDAYHQGKPSLAAMADAKKTKAHPNQTKNSLLSVLKSLIFTEFLFKTVNYIKLFIRIRRSFFTYTYRKHAE